MSETAEQKNKRQFLIRLNDYVWDRQVSVFFDAYQDTLDALEHSKKIRGNISRAFPNSPFLYRLCMRAPTEEQAIGIGIPDGEPNVVPYLVFFTLNLECETPVLCNRISSWVDVSLNVKQQVFSEERKLGYGNTVRRERPHNLSRFFGDRKITRSTLLNKNRLLSV